MMFDSRTLVSRFSDIIMRVTAKAVLPAAVALMLLWLA
jgi:hypothetical protein